MRDRLIKLVEECGDACLQAHVPLTSERIADHLLTNGVILSPVVAGQTVYHFCVEFGAVMPYCVQNVHIGFWVKTRHIGALKPLVIAKKTMNSLTILNSTQATSEQRYFSQGEKQRIGVESMTEYVERQEILKHKRTIEMPGPFGKTYTGCVVNAYHVENAPAADVIPADEVRQWLKKADEVFMKSCLSVEAYTAWQRLKEYFEVDG